MATRSFHLSLLVVALLCITGLSDSGKLKDDECSVSREFIMLMTAVYVDKDNDNLISKHELQNVWDSVLSKNEKALVSVIGSKIESPQVIMDHCGGGEDGYISMKDFMTYTDTCLNECWKLEDMQNKFLPRIKALLPPGSDKFYEKRIQQKQKLLD